MNIIIYVCVCYKYLRIGFVNTLAIIINSMCNLQKTQLMRLPIPMEWGGSGRRSVPSESRAADKQRKLRLVAAEGEAMWMWIWDVGSWMLTTLTVGLLVGVGVRWCLKFLQVNQPVSFSCFVISVCVIFVFLLLLTRRPTDRPTECSVQFILALALLYL